MRCQAMSSSAPDRPELQVENWSADMPDQPSVADSPAVADASASCPACAHELDAHDALGIRFCTATAAKHLERTCICPVHHETHQYYTRTGMAPRPTT